MAKPSFTGTQAQQVRKVYKELAVEVNSWLYIDPDMIDEPEYLQQIARIKFVTLQHAILYHKIMKIFRCESKVMLISTR